MSPLLSRSLSLSLPILIAGIAPAQDEAESPIGGTPAVEIVRELESEPELVEALKTLNSAWGEEPGGEGELRAVKLVVQQATGRLNLQDAKQIVQSLRKVIGKGEALLPEREPVYREAVDGLSRFGGLGGEVLLDYLDSERIRVRPETQGLRGHVLLALAKTGHPRVPELLIETVRSSSEPRLTADAGRAMKAYADAPRKQRQKFVEVLARRMAGLENVASRRPGDPGRYRDLGREDAEDDLATVREVWNPTLAALTGEHHRTGQAWWEWYQEHGDERWPADPKPEDDK